MSTNKCKPPQLSTVTVIKYVPDFSNQLVTELESMNIHRERSYFIFWYQLLCSLLFGTEAGLKLLKSVSKRKQIQVEY